MDDRPQVFDWDSVDASEPFPGIVRQALVTTTSTVVRYTYHPGCVFPVHQHPEEQITIVHSGEIEFEVAGEPVTLRAGQIAVIPGGVPHGARVTNSETVVTDNYIASASRTPLKFEGSQS
jgi:quercetin dioxygenase-like cupin family protein